MLVGGDGGAEDFASWSEAQPGVGEGGVGVLASSSRFGSPRDVAIGVAAGSRDFAITFFGSTLRRVGGGGRPCQPFFDSPITIC